MFNEGDCHERNVLQASDYTIPIMLIICVVARYEVCAKMLSDEAAGNNEPPLGTNGLQVRREAQDFRRGDVKGVTLMNVRE